MLYILVYFYENVLEHDKQEHNKVRFRIIKNKRLGTSKQSISIE